MANISLKDKKILYLVTQTKWGGAQKYVLDLAKHFKKHNEVHIAYGEVDHPDPRFFEICQKLDIKTIPINTLVRNINPAREILAIIDILKILNKTNYSLLHLNSSKAGVLGSFAAKLYAFNLMNTKLRVVYTAHGFVFHEPLPNLQIKLYKTMETISTALETAVITVSKFDKTSAIAQKICPEYKMFTIHNGLDFSEYNFLDKEEARQKLGLDKNKFYFGTIASFYPVKGYVYLLEAIKLLKEDHSALLNTARWVLIGDGPDLDKIKKLADEYQIKDYLKFVNSSGEDWKYLKAFDCFVLPSVKEGLPYAILEAGLAEIPVIATKVGGIPEILKNDRPQGDTGLLVPPANPLSLTKAMEKIARDQKMSELMTINNNHNIRTHFSLTQQLAKTEELYLKLF